MKIWDVQTGHELLTLKGGGYLDTVSFSPDGRRLVSDVGLKVTIWDATPLPEESLVTPAPASDRVLTLDEIFTLLDKNQDGRIAKAEAVGQYAQRFSTWDINTNGFADREEIRDFRARMGIDDQGQRTGIPGK